MHVVKLNLFCCSDGYGAKDTVGFLIELPEDLTGKFVISTSSPSLPSISPCVVRDLPRTHKDKVVLLNRV